MDNFVVGFAQLLVIGSLPLLGKRNVNHGLQPDDKTLQEKKSKLGAEKENIFNRDPPAPLFFLKLLYLFWQRRSICHLEFISSSAHLTLEGVFYPFSFCLFNPILG